ncbi:MAG: UbiA family prenyltransferase [Patescibacteria group bacterium]|nr:UbiA family prenyltransferase [Patescibacteria group bacterium]
MRIPALFRSKCEKLVNFLESAPISVQTWSVSFVAILTVRFFFESVFLNFESVEFFEFLASFLHGTVLFFLFSFVLSVLFLMAITGENIKKIANVVLWGQWLAVLPPIIDKIIFKDRQVWSFYIFDSVKGLAHRFVTFFGDNPDFGVTWGTRGEVLIAMVFLGIYVYIKKKKVIWLFLGVFFSYILFFILGVFPSIVTFVVEMIRGNDLFAINKAHVIKLFLTPARYLGIEKGTIKTALSFKLALVYNILLFCELIILQFFVNKKKFMALVKNIRYPQMSLNIGLLFVGIGLGCFYFPQNFSLSFFSILAVANLLIAIFSAWYFSVFVNDLADIAIDKITNASRPLITKTLTEDEFKTYSLVFLVISLLSGMVISVKVFLLLALYLLVTWVYSQYPLRLKQFVFISSALSSFALLLFLTIGYISLSDGQTLNLFPWKIIIFLFVVYALLVPIKDLKDTKGDRRAGIATLPCLIGTENARIILGAILFLSYFGSAVILSEKKLFIPAILFGIINYYIMASRKYNVRALPWWVLGIVFVYAILLVLITFG